MHPFTRPSIPSSTYSFIHPLLHQSIHPFTFSNIKWHGELFHGINRLHMGVDSPWRGKILTNLMNYSGENFMPQCLNPNVAALVKSPEQRIKPPFKQWKNKKNHNIKSKFAQKLIKPAETIGHSSYFRFDDDNKTKYTYSLNHHKGNG